MSMNRMDTRSLGIDTMSASTISSESHNQAENSSCVSIDFSSGDNQQDRSTSGCSSEVSNMEKVKMMRQRKMKACICELKTLLSNTDGLAHDKTPRTLSVLQNALTFIRRNIHEINPADEGPSAESPVVLKYDNNDQTTKDYLLKIDCSKNTVKDVTKQLLDLLGFTKESWLGRDITRFVSKKDATTFFSALYQWSNKEDPDWSYPAFFARFRCQQLMGEHYGLSSVSQHIALKMKMIEKQMYQKESQSSSTDPISNDSDKCVILKLQRCISAHTDEGRDVDKSFSIQHSIQCKIIHLSKNTPYILGFLPQDMLGSSIFNFYHPEELKDLLETYKQTILAKGQSYRSSKFRIKTQNNDWVSVETEWSCFISPYKSEVSLIMAKHTVIEGPSNPLVFEETLDSNHNSDTGGKTSHFQKKIMKLLKQPLDEQSSSSSTSKVNTGSEDYHYYGMGNTSSEPKASNDSKKNESSIENRSEHGESGNTSTSYGQLNYTYNIKRYLKSCPLTFDTKAIDDDFISDTDSDQEVEMEFIASPLHSVNSSIKVNMADDDVETGSVLNPVMDDSHLSSDDFRHTEEGHNPASSEFKHVNLTQETLRKHTKLQKKLYMNKVEKTRGIRKMKTSGNGTEISRKRSRRSQDDHLASDSKFVKFFESNKHIDTSNALYQQNIPFTGTSIPMNSIGDSIFPNSFPFLPVETNYQMLSVRENQLNPGLQWPFYSNSNPGYGMIEGFDESNSPETSLDDSNMYIDCPTQMPSTSGIRESGSIKRKREMNDGEPFTLTRAETMKYEMPYKNLNDVLRKDKVFLKENKSGPWAKEQLQCLLQEINMETSAKDKQKFEENLSLLGHQLQVHMESRVQEELATNHNFESNLICEEEGGYSCATVDCLGDSVMAQNDEDKPMDAQSPKSDVDFKQSSSVISDKLSSDITQSDQHSSNESTSSLKESDGSSEKPVSKYKTKAMRGAFFKNLFKSLTLLKEEGNPFMMKETDYFDFDL